MWSRSLRNKKKEEGFTGAQQVYDCALDLLSYRDYSHKLRHQAENLSRCRLDGHHGSALAHHERLGVLLQLYVEAKAEVASR